MSQRSIIINVLRQYPERWFKAYELRGRPTPDGKDFFGHQGDRRARELAEEGVIEVRHENKYAEYRIKMERQPQQLSLIS